MSGSGFAYSAQFAGFMRPTLYNIFSNILFMFLIDAIKPNIEKKFILVIYATV